MNWDRLLINARLATMRAGAGPYGAIESAALGISKGRITFAGPMGDLPGRPTELAGCVDDMGGRWITPGLIDCHTHLVFAGNRAAEFEMRLQGRTYEEIARAGGGIMSTVRATRAASDAGLLDATRRRLDALAGEGVTTVEIKSGYGLDAQTELRLLRTAHAAGKAANLSIATTFLGLHALPPGIDRTAFIAEMAGPVLKQVAQEKLATAVDAFCEGIAFTPDETEAFFTAANKAGLRVKLHADQLSDTGGAALAARFKALSADHLEYTNEAGVLAMAKAGTVAVMLPAAFFCLRETRLPPVDLLRRYGVPLAVASDCNPGTAPILSLLGAMAMAATLFRLTPEEVLKGVTVNAARALGLHDDRGTLEPGKRADIAVWPVEHPAELSYWLGGLRPDMVIRGQ
jgi:imidazolonepropionase